jgi:drug/metabolite transporter (DMT)-like permease
MPFGLLAGLGAAITWGTLDIATALASRRIGALRVTAGMQLVGAILLGALALATGTSLPSDPATVAISILLGLIGAAAYLSYFTGLAIGPISVVSGMVAAYGGLTVILSVAFRGETLTAIQALGAVLATVGVILTGVAFTGGLRAIRFAGPGVIFAVIALVLFALMTIVSDIAFDRAGWLQVLLTARIANTIVSIAIIGLLSSRQAGRVDPSASAWSSARILAAIVIAGTLDVAGLISFAIGLDSAPTWMVGLASSFGPAVTIMVAVAVLGERLKPIQWLGLAAVVAGMIAIGLP